MPVTVVPCGPPASESERQAFESLKSFLHRDRGHWFLLTNLDFHHDRQRPPDEIDAVVVGPHGVTVVEVKPWAPAFVRTNNHLAEKAKALVAAKAKRVAGTLRNAGVEAGFVRDVLLSTHGDARAAQTAHEIFGVTELARMLRCGEPRTIENDAAIRKIVETIKPAAQVAAGGHPRRIGDLINLELVPALAERDDRFHRVYRGIHRGRGNRVYLHLYDLTCRDVDDSEYLARREFDAMHAWQRSSFVPAILDSFQDVRDHEGELKYFTHLDPMAPPVEVRQVDPQWQVEARLKYAIAATAAAVEFHHPTDPAQRLIHRRITPRTLRVTAGNAPLFTGFAHARIQGRTISGYTPLWGPDVPFIAPEVRTGSLANADERSDAFGLCSTLFPAFDPDVSPLAVAAHPLAKSVREVLELGRAIQPANRLTLVDLHQKLAALALPARGPDVVREDPDPHPMPVHPRYWSEGHVIRLGASSYRVLNHLGDGGIGRTFKVEEINSQGGEAYPGVFVAKTINGEADARVAMEAHRHARALTAQNPHLATIHETSQAWSEMEPVCLLGWISGHPLADYRGMIEIVREDLDEPSTNHLVRRWLTDLCQALAPFHAAGLVHGDVSPKNIIVDHKRVVLTDYDAVTRSGAVPRFATEGFASERVAARLAVNGSDDLFALASSFYNVLTDIDPFVRDGEVRRQEGLDWTGIDIAPDLRSFFDRATDPNPERRFANASAALESLRLPDASDPPPVLVLQPNQEKWLDELLAAYPGARHGNRETRGLDSTFAHDTYVPTALDDLLLGEIDRREVSLVILTGNAGDGKTAFLQHLARRLGVGDVPSSGHLWEHVRPDGTHLLANLDGAAAWNGRTADEWLDDLFLPFQDGSLATGRIHLVAVNSGKLLEWIEARHDWPLASLLRAGLAGGVGQSSDSRIRFLDLNERSLVGALPRTAVGAAVNTVFLDTLVSRFVDGPAEPVPRAWSGCPTCSGQKHCTAWASVQALREPRTKTRIRARLAEALQACHQRGEIHITARELRATLSYVFFGMQSCAEVHVTEEASPVPYWQRAFDAEAEGRQGDLLAELARLDPALDADPAGDRAMVAAVTETAPGLPSPPAGRLAYLRRRAWFEREDDQPGRARLFGGARLERFRTLYHQRPDERQVLVSDLCGGISRLEDLPHVAFDHARRVEAVPVRVTPQTPTESVFWVLKPIDRFAIDDVVLPPAGLETLHTRIQLRYGANGHVERLAMGLELFTLLLDLNDGVQLTGKAHDAHFANIGVFTRRLAFEDLGTVYGWHPGEGNRIFRIGTEMRNGRLVIVRQALPEGDRS